MLDEPNNFDNENTENPADNEPMEEGAPPEETSNRTFLIVAGVLGFLILLTLAGIAAYIFYFGPRLNTTKLAAQQTRNAENSLAIANETATAEAALFTPTSEPTAEPTNTIAIVQPTNTPVVAVGAGATATTNLAESSTLVFLQTQLAVQLTSTAAAAKTTPTGALASTGFFDEVGLPGLIVLTLALLGVIFLARRLRTAPVR